MSMAKAEVWKVSTRLTTSSGFFLAFMMFGSDA